MRATFHGRRPSCPHRHRGDRPSAGKFNDRHAAANSVRVPLTDAVKNLVNRILSRRPGAVVVPTAIQCTAIVAAQLSPRIMLKTQISEVCHRD